MWLRWREVAVQGLWAVQLLTQAVVPVVASTLVGLVLALQGGHLAVVVLVLVAMPARLAVMPRRQTPVVEVVRALVARPVLTADQRSVAVLAVVAVAAAAGLRRKTAAPVAVMHTPTQAQHVTPLALHPKAALAKAAAAAIHRLPLRPQGALVVLQLVAEAVVAQAATAARSEQEAPVRAARSR